MINMEVGEREKELAQTRTKEIGEVQDPPFFLLSFTPWFVLTMLR